MILSLLLLVLLVYLLLWLPPVQQKIKDIALREVMKITGSRIEVGQLRFRPFNALVLEEIYAEDLQGDTLLYAGELKTRFDLWPLLHDHLLIRSVELSDFMIGVSKLHPDSTYNFQFLADAFASSDTTSQKESSKLVIEIDDLSLKGGRLRYDILSELPKERGLFDVNHISIEDLTASINLTSIDPERLNVTLKELSLKEQSGFILEQLTLNLRSKGKKIVLNDLGMRLPDSRLTVKGEVDYTGLSLNRLQEGATYSLQLSIDPLSPGDITCFYPGLSTFTESLLFSAEMKGKLPEINATSVELKYGNNLHIQADARLDDFNRWDHSALSFHLKKLYTDEAAIGQILRFSTGKTAPPLFPSGSAFQLSGKVTGSLPQLDLALKGKYDEGTIGIEGKGGYMVRSGESNFEIALVSEKMDIGKLLSDPLYGKASLNLDGKGKISSNGRMDITAGLLVREFGFRNYTYRDIRANGSYNGDSIRMALRSDDPNLDLELSGGGNIGKKHPSAHLFADLKQVRLDTLNLLAEYPESRFSGIIRAETSGFDPEKMNASLSIDSLYVATATGQFEDTGITASYRAEDDGGKQLSLRSKALNIRSRGQFTFAAVGRSIKEAFPVLFPAGKSSRRPTSPGSLAPEHFNLVLSIRRSNTLMPLLGIKQEIPDSALLVTRYNNDGEKLHLDATAFCILDETDTLKVSVDLSDNQNNLDVSVHVDNRSPDLAVNGSIAAEVEFIPRLTGKSPDIDIAFKPTAISLNGTPFNIRPSSVSIREKRYEVRDFTLEHTPAEFVRIDGIVSEGERDSLSLQVGDFRIETVMAALKMKIPVSGVASGEINAYRLLDKPFIMTRRFMVDSIFFENNQIGRLTLMSGWSSARQGVVIRSALTDSDQNESVVQGFYLPAKDSLLIRGDLKALKLAWLDSYLEENIYGLGGDIGARFLVTGTSRDPNISGSLFLNRATFGVKMLETLYSISDSIEINSSGLALKNFSIVDEQNKRASINGTIRHQHFSDITPELRVRLDDFLVLNNANRTDSLFYGKIRLRGDLNVRLQNSDWLISGNLTHGNDNRIMINLPSSPESAQRYNNITYINTEEEVSYENESKSETKSASLPIRLNLSFTVSPQLNLGAVYNLVTGDKAQVTGSGKIDFSYYLPTPASMSLLGSFEVEEGDCTLSLANITRKKFTIQEGGKVTFRGDPMQMSFDVTAIYALRADLASLDQGFSNLGMSSTRVPVNCILEVSGNLEKMQLGYQITLPTQPEEISRKMDGLLYTEDLKIRQIAYLLALGSFMPADGNPGGASSGSIWTSLASSSITNQLNHLLSGVLSDNWSVGTSLHTSDGSFSDVEMDVNISTRLFDDRLTINSSLGYQNDATGSDNFTGDFDFEYKLTSSGNILLRFYNVTNNQYFEQARTTQGIGIVYRREGKTFPQLFRSFRNRTKVPPIPASTLPEVTLPSSGEKEETKDQGEADRNGVQTEKTDTDKEER